MAEDKLMERIKKLMALSESSNENEAALAMQRAQELMEKHGINSDKMAMFEIGEVWVKSRQSVSQIKDWEGMVVEVVAIAFGCKTLWQSGNSYNRKDPWGKYGFVGPKVKLELVEYTANVLLDKVTKARREYNKKLNDQGFGGLLDRKTITYKLDGYCQGWASAILKKVVAFANPNETQDAINAKVNEIVGDKDAKTSQSRLGDAASAARGFLEGGDVDIHRPMRGAEEQRKLT